MRANWNGLCKSCPLPFQVLSRCCMVYGFWDTIMRCIQHYKTIDDGFPVLNICPQVSVLFNKNTHIAKQTFCNFFLLNMFQKLERQCRVRALVLHPIDFGLNLQHHSVPQTVKSYSWTQSLCLLLRVALKAKLCVCVLYFSGRRDDSMGWAHTLHAVGLNSILSTTWSTEH